MAIRTDIYSIDWSVSPRVIWIDDSITEADAQDLYDTCKYLESQIDGIDEPQICDAGGWEPLGSGNFVVITISLFNAVYAFEDRPGPDWVICNMGGGNVVAFTDETRTVTMYPRKPTAYVSADRTSSSSGTLKEAAAIEYASFQNSVWIDIVNGYDEDQAKYNREFPGKDLLTAINVAKTKGFSIIQILSSMTLDSGSDFKKFKIVGQSHVNTVITISDSAQCEGVVFNDVKIEGILDGGNEITRCVIGELQYVNGHIHDSGWLGKITLGGSKDAYIVDTRQIDIDVDPYLNMGGFGQDAVISGFSGKLHIENMTSNKVGVGISSGQVILENTVTGGLVHVSGQGVLVDENGREILSGTWNGVTIINETTSGREKFAQGIYLDEVNGASGTDDPIGSRYLPSNNWADLLAIASNRNVKTINVIGDTVLTQAVEKYTIKALNPHTGSVDINGQSVLGSNFESITIFGANVNYFEAKDCELNDISNINCDLENCIISGTFSIKSGGKFNGDRCTSPANTIINANGNGSIGLANLSGVVTIANMTDPAATIGITGMFLLTLLSSCTNGSYLVAGVGIFDNQGTITGIDRVIGTGALTPTQADQLEKLYKLRGFDPSSPVTHKQDSIKFDDVEIEVTGDENETILTRKT